MLLTAAHALPGSGNRKLLSAPSGSLSSSMAPEPDFTTPSTLLWGPVGAPGPLPIPDLAALSPEGQAVTQGEVNYDGVDVVAAARFSYGSAYPDLGGSEATYHQVFSAQMASFGFDVQVVTLGQVPAPESFPIVSQLNHPPFQATLFSIEIQHTGPGLLPFGIGKQDALLLELSTLITAQGGAAYLNITGVTEQAAAFPAGAGNVTVTMVAQHDTKSVDMAQTLDFTITAAAPNELPLLLSKLVSAGVPVTSINLTSFQDNVPNYTVIDQYATYAAERSVLATVKSAGLGGGAIAGIVIGGLVAISVPIAIIAYLILRWRRHRQWQRRTAELAVAKSIDSDQASDQAPDPKLAQNPSAPATQSDKDSDSDPPSSGVHNMKLQDLAFVLTQSDTSFKTDNRDMVWETSGATTGADSSQSHEGASSDSSHLSTTARVSQKHLVTHASTQRLEPWSIDPREIEVCRDERGPIRLGHGGYGAVYKCVRQGVQDVAVKIVFASSSGDVTQLDTFKRETSIMMNLSFHGNIVQFYGACCWKQNSTDMGGTPMLVLEYMEGGDLRNALTEHSAELRWWLKGKRIAMDIARGLAYLHSQRVMHGDIKSRNVLLNGSRNLAKIADCGLARVLDNTGVSASRTRPIGTMAYAAPEFLLGTNVRESADMYSFGVLLWELVTTEVPLRGQLRPLRVPEECPAEIRDLIEDCTERPPAERPTANQAYHRIKVSPDSPSEY
eukprot:jgi/Astpho2/4533/Aster-00122